MIPECSRFPGIEVVQPITIQELKKAQEDKITRTTMTII